MSSDHPPSFPPDVVDDLGAADTSRPPASPADQPGLLYLSKCSEPVLRQYAAYLAHSYVPSTLSDPRFEEVTQGRAHAAGYSSCGDLCHWLLWRLGCRIEHFVNRDEPDAGFRWASGKNVAYLGPYGLGPRLGCWTHFRLGQVPQPGDLVLVGDMAKGEVEHLFVLLEVSPDGLVWYSADFGQSCVVKNVFVPCSKLQSRTLKGDKLDGRTVLGWSNLAAVPLVEAANLTVP